jgi:hypothetical protein
MMKKLFATVVGTVAGLALGGHAMAAVSADEAAKLGTVLTPLGGEKSANADGSIPAWDGGLTSPAQAGFANFRAGQHHPDPYAGDKPLYTVTAANMGQYASKLTEGHKKVLQTYRATFKMNVYPTHRSGAAPQRIYDATKRIATTAQLATGGNGVTNAGHRAPDRPGPRDRRRLVHDGQIPRRDDGGVQPAGCAFGESRQHHRVLHPGDRGARAARG